MRAPHASPEQLKRTEIYGEKIARLLSCRPAKHIRRNHGLRTKNVSITCGVGVLWRPVGRLPQMATPRIGAISKKWSRDPTPPQQDPAAPVIETDVPLSALAYGGQALAYP